MSSGLEVTFLRDLKHGGDPHQAAEVAVRLAGFVSAATTSVDVAIYDFRLTDDALASTVVSALTAAAERGVTVRIAYDAGKPAAGDAESFAALQADPAPPGTQDWLTGHFSGTPVEIKPIKAGRQLMHSKYVVRDEAAVWTGSTNFTDDAWSRQENNIVVVTSSAAATAYRADFEQLWSTGTITGSGAGSAGETSVDGHVLGWDFCPGDGPEINSLLAARVTAATSRVVVGAMVLTSHEVLAALAAAIDRGVPVSGIYDSGQMNPIIAELKKNPKDAQVVADWTKVSAHLAHKRSFPYKPTGVHNFMHLKVLITDDVVSTGSYNFSANAERNAENQLHLTDPATVSAYADYLDAVVAAYQGTR